MRALIGVVLGLLAAAAQAAPVTYDFSYTQTAVGFSGGTGTGDISGQFSVEGGAITGITGTTALFGAITGLVSPGGFPIGAPNSNAFSAASPWLDENGVAFRTASQVFNLAWASWNGTWQGLTEQTGGGGSTDGRGTLAVTLAGGLGDPRPVPAPGGVGLLAAALLGLAAARRRTAGRG
jgi:hypothetical protein